MIKFVDKNKENEIIYLGTIDLQLCVVFFYWYKYKAIMHELKE